MVSITPTHKANASRSPLYSVFVCLGALALSACGSGSGSDNEAADGSSDVAVDSAGRLVMYQSEASALSVLDLDSGVVERSFPLAGESPRIYPSASDRYAVVVQRDQGQVSFLDSGLYVEDHGDHLHEYKDEPTMSAAMLTGTRPTHVTQSADLTAVFYDGQDGAVSSVQLLDDASIRAGAPRIAFDLENNMHGVAKPVGDQLFVTYRDPAITDTTLPAAVERFAIGADSVSWQHRYSEPCPRLHGSDHNGAHLLFGCSDGVLAIDLTQASYPATKLANPTELNEDSRIGSIYAQQGVASFVGRARDQFFIIEPASGSLPRVLSLPEGESPIDQGFTHSGEWFYVLGASGTLHLFDVEQGFAPAPMQPFDSAYPDTVSGRLVTQSGSGETLYVLSPTASEIVAISADTQLIMDRMELGFVASNPTWLGLSDSAEQAHDEDGHDHES